jgi:hypothetical protein
MKFLHDGYAASIQHNWEHDKEFWTYTICRVESGEVLYQGFSKNALEVVGTVEERIKLLGMRKSN